MLRIFKKIKSWINFHKTLRKRLNALDSEIHNIKQARKEIKQLVEIQEDIINSLNEILVETENKNKLISQHTSGLNTIVISKKSN